MSDQILNCDMDGVLVDMDHFIRTHLHPDDQDDPSRMWPALQRIPGMYRKMRPTPYARQLWSAIMDLCPNRRLLTALPLVTKMPDAQKDKNQWVDLHRKRVFCGERPEVLVGPYSKDKYRHCRPGDILIEDREDNCEAWTKAGGIAILHTGDVKKTIRLLSQAVQ